MVLYVISDDCVFLLTQKILQSTQTEPSIAGLAKYTNIRSEWMSALMLMEMQSIIVRK